MPLESIIKFVVKEGHARFLTPPIGSQGSIGLTTTIRSCGTPVIELIQGEIIIISMCVGASLYNVGASEEYCKEHHTASTKICNVPLSAYGSNHLPKPLDFSYYYQTIGVKLQEVEPEICYIEPEDDYVRERFWKGEST